MEQEHIKETSMLYMAEGIRAISENTCETGGMKLTRKLSELFGHNIEEEDGRTAENIISSIKDGLERLGEE